MKLKTTNDREFGGTKHNYTAYIIAASDDQLNVALDALEAKGVAVDGGIREEHGDEDESALISCYSCDWNRKSDWHKAIRKALKGVA